MFNETLETLKVIQQMCNDAIEKEGYRFIHISEYPSARKKFFAQFNKWFPKSTKRDPGEKKPQGYRHRIVMAMTGIPIDSMKDLPLQIWSILIEVTDEQSEYLTDGISLAIQEGLESPSILTPWNLSSWQPKAQASNMPDLFEDDLPF